MESHGRRGQNFLGSRTRRRNENGPSTRRSSGVHIRADVANDHTIFWAHAQRSGGAIHEARFGFTTVALAAFAMLANKNRPEWPKQFFRARIHGTNVLRSEMPERYAGLVRNYRSANTGIPQSSKCGLRVRHGRDLKRVRVTGNVYDDGSVPIEKDSERLRHSASKP